MKHLAIDIETVGLGKPARDYVMENTSVAYGNIKDPEKRKAKRDAVINKLTNQLGLRWFTGKIISISIVDCVTDEKTCYYGDNEKEILTAFNDLFKHNGAYRIYGKNISTFDAPFIIGRMLANGITPKPQLKDRNRIEDIDTYFGYSSASNQRGKLNEYCFGLGIEGKKGMTGADVQPMYDLMLVSNDSDSEALFWEKIKNYNIDDSEIVAKIVRLYYGNTLK